MLFNDLGHVRSADLRIPNTVRIDHHRGADGAETNRSALGQYDAAVRVLALCCFAKKNSAFFQLQLKRFDYFRAADRGTGLTRAYKHMMANRRSSHRREVAQLFRIVEK